MAKRRNAALRAPMAQERANEKPPGSQMIQAAFGESITVGGHRRPRLSRIFR
ncbi:hypothetical protein ACTRXD_00395 [Nitrospira sp. T9]|uniref:hypothetical protein n=1 Tax=unclassified Nitrospira TaxID=2652172 RepID=UPI003F9E5A80